jgi:starch-binding outer membrane protein, SusD/RagB family
MKKILFILVITLAFSACSDSYLDTINKNTLDMGSFFKTENDLLLATNAAYTSLAYGIADTYNRRGMFGAEYMLKMNELDPYMWFEKPNSGLDQLVINTSDFEGYYDAMYTGLYRTSDILAKMHTVQNLMDSTTYNKYKGQVQALRGMYYFYLVTWYNKPVYYDETNVPYDPLATYTNGTPEEFWNKLEEDLTSAAKILPQSWPNEELGRITSGAAYAQLGKALLYKHYHYYLRFGKGGTAEAIANLQKAKDALKHVMDSKVYHLILPVNKTKEDYQAALLSNSSYLPVPPMNAAGVITNTYFYPAENNAESIWEIQYNDDNRNATGWLPGEMWGGNLNYLFSSPHLGSYKNLEIDPSLWYEFETVTSHPAGYTRDPRAYATCYLDGDLMDWRPESGYKVGFLSGLNSQNIVSKNALYKGDVPSKSLVAKKYAYPQFVDKTAPSCAPFNVRVIRYADVLLMFSEAAYQLDKDADGSGVAALNEVRARVDMPGILSLTPAAIVHERTVELATEGLHYNDIIRWMYDPNFGMDMVKLFNGKFNKDKNYCFPIPQAEIDANKGTLKQNPGW